MSRFIGPAYELRGAARFLSPAGDPLDDVLLGLCGQGRADVMAVAQRQLSRISAATDIKSLQDAGSWTSPAMPLRYVESQAIANEGVKLG